MVGFLEDLKKSQGLMRGLLIFFAALLVMGGPTYLLLILDRLGLPRLVILAAGLATLTAGLFLFTIILKDES